VGARTVAAQQIHGNVTTNVDVRQVTLSPEVAQAPDGVAVLSGRLRNTPRRPQGSGRSPRRTSAVVSLSDDNPAAVQGRRPVMEMHDSTQGDRTVGPPLASAAGLRSLAADTMPSAQRGIAGCHGNG